MKNKSILKFNESVMLEYEYSLEQLWDRYEQRGKNDIIKLIRNMYIEFHNKNVGFYGGRGVIGILPYYSYKDKVKKMLFNTVEHGTLEVDDDYSITIKDPRLL